ncbi:WD40-repeat-containing domain protein [Vararia minispora EC-137]|uniref:WD40-repeat-containing domain protein n=1 Tax=Vararia minispora EC-137 TaxID=1314806 RepID=A0ACB8QCQ8_9AGAM|nr:WD40-repeat-containing domain protein [Vararia minispora EC-137]
MGQNGLTIPPKPFKVAANEVNCLIHAYLRDAGFQHTAFSLRSEAFLEKSTEFTKHVPHGELVDLLSKALLFQYIEKHGLGEPTCIVPMSLLERHVCAEAPSEPALAASPTLATLSGDSGGVGQVADSPTSNLRTASKQVRLDDIWNCSSQPKPAAPSRQISTSRQEKTDQNANAMDIDGDSGSVGPMLETDVPPTTRILPGVDSEIFTLSWCRENPTLLATGAKDATLTIWKLPLPLGTEGEPEAPTSQARIRLTATVDGDVTALDWHPDGETLAVGSYDAKLRIINSMGELQMTDASHQSPIFGARWSPDGRWLVTASLDQQSCLWDMKDRRIVCKTFFQREWPLLCLAFVEPTLSCVGCCLDCAWINNELYVVCGGDYKVTIMSVNSPIPVTLFVGHGNEVNQLRLNETRMFIASASDDMTARIWNVAHILTPAGPDQPTPNVTDCVVLRGHSQSVNTVGWSGTQAGPELIATASFDMESRVWDPRTGACLCVFKDHTKPLFTLTFSKSGLWLLTGAGDGYVIIYDVQDRKKVWSWRVEGKQTRGVFDLAVQAVRNTERVAVALESGRVAIIDLRQLRALQSKPW